MAEILTFPMHGERKLRNEGFRTRDGHVIEWLASLLAPSTTVDVISRPEPLILPRITRLRGVTPAGIRFHSPRSLRIPIPTDPKRWWAQSLPDYTLPRDTTESAPALIWNPLVGNSSISALIFNGVRRVHADLLDDWLVHHAFASIRKEVKDGYSVIFDRAQTVTVNSEGTLALAHSFGRNDAVLVPNGCDPERFSPVSLAAGPTTIGYVGKIGRRVDLELITQMSKGLPECQIVLAGPILDREYRKPLAGLKNVRLLGDVPYEKVPQLLQTFDIGWVPHRVGDGEVGGDAIKIYEYRAAGLPVLSTPIIGAGSRDLSGVHVLGADEHIDWVRKHAAAEDRVARILDPIDQQHTWSSKTRRMLEMLIPGS